MLQVQSLNKWCIKGWPYCGLILHHWVRLMVAHPTLGYWNFLFTQGTKENFIRFCFRFEIHDDIYLKVTEKKVLPCKNTVSTRYRLHSETGSLCIEYTEIQVHLVPQNASNFFFINKGDAFKHSCRSVMITRWMDFYFQITPMQWANPARQWNCLDFRSKMLHIHPAKSDLKHFQSVLLLCNQSASF